MRFLSKLLILLLIVTGTSFAGYRGKVIWHRSYFISLGVDALICGGIGGGAQAALAQAGIMLCGGVSGSADEAAESFAAGRLAYSAEANCGRHGGHGEHSCGSHEEHSCGHGEHSCGSHGCH